MKIFGILTHNGALLPTNDYWYAIELTKSDGSVFIKQGHYLTLISVNFKILIRFNWE